MKQFKRWIVMLFIVLGTVILTPGVGEAKEGADAPQGIQIPQEVQAFAEENLHTVTKDLSREEIFDSNSTVKLAKPFVVYNGLICQEGIYYFPLMQNNNIIINMIVFDTEDGLQIQLTDDMAGDLNDFHYVDTDTVLYEYNGDTYIENAGQRETIC